MKKIFLFSFFIFISLAPSFSQNFYAIDTVQKIEISFTQPNWDYILDTAKQGTDSYTLSQWVRINGVQFDSAGVKYKGNSSYNPNNAKNPFHIELDHFKNQNYLGYKDIKLSNGFNEPSFIREVMLYNIFQNYSEASRANFAQVYINGQYWGVYTNVEAVTKTFLDDRFYTNNHTFVFADQGGCDLKYKGNDSTLYYTPYTMKSNYGHKNLMNLCDSLNNNISKIENILDVDRTLWWLAYCNSMVILDSYLGNSKHNYYIYEDHNKRFNPIIWDLNGGFGIFNKANMGTGPGLTLTEMQNMSAFLHDADVNWPLVKNLLAVPLYRHMYLAHMKTLMSENIANNSYYNLGLQLQAIVDTAVLSDTKKFASYSDFLNNLNNNVVVGPKTVPGITFLMNARNTYLNSTPEFQQAQPAISNIASSNAFPLVNTNVFITASVSNATAVYLGYRYSKMERFNRVPMFDDGLHGDGTAGDGVYGVPVSVNNSEVHYYIYADNANAGIFSPVRAEHEYYTLQANYTILSAGQVVINEILAINNTNNQNANGKFGDWIELYNTTSNSVSLDYLNISDNSTNFSKWQFPFGKTIAPNGFLVVWADKDTSTSEIHCDFSFSGNGETAIIGYANGTIIDSVTFPAQVADVSWGRYPNGTGPFVVMSPTFNATNSLSSIGELDQSVFLIYPNPTAGEIKITSLRNNIKSIEVTNVLGDIILDNRIGGRNINMSLSHLNSGLYFVKISTVEGSIVRKIVKE